MADNSTQETSVSEREIREIVREELQAATSNTTTRRSVLGMVGAAGLAGLAGCQLDNSSNPEEPQSTADEVQLTDLRITNDGSNIAERVQALNFGRNLSTAVDDDRVTVNAEHGVDVANGDADSARVSNIDVGAGLDASIEDGTLRISRSESQLGTGNYVARPNDVQSALDDAFVDEVGQVNLVSGVSYELGDSVEVPPGVTLDCTGARVNVQSDVNVFELNTQSQVTNPHVNTTGIDGYSSSIFHVAPTGSGGAFGTDRPVPVWTVSGGLSEMTPGEGTCIELHGQRENPEEDYDVREHNRNVYFCCISHNCVGGHRYAYLHREGGDTTKGGHVNSNIIRGYAQNATRFIETDDSAGSGKNMVNGNKFYMVTQPGSESEWLWYANKGSRNELYEWGTNWDYARYSDNDGDGYAESWYIGENAGMNFVWRRRASASGGLGSTVVDDSNGSSGSKYLLLEQMGTDVSELDVWDDAQ